MVAHGFFSMDEICATMGRRHADLFARVTETERKGDRWVGSVGSGHLTFPVHASVVRIPLVMPGERRQNNVWYFAPIRPCGTKHSGLICPDSPDSMDHRAMARAHKPLAPKAVPRPQDPRDSALGECIAGGGIRGCCCRRIHVPPAWMPSMRLRAFANRDGGRNGSSLGAGRPETRPKPAQVVKKPW